MTAGPAGCSLPHDEQTRLNRIKFTVNSVERRGDRIHYLTDDDIRIVLSRLPLETWRRLRHVHFNDRSRGARVLGYVNRGHREIAICALPPRISMTRFLMRDRKQSPGQFGAVRGTQWPTQAIRRFMLYDVFLHELGHLQMIDPTSRDVWRKFALEKKAQDFADYWRERLWLDPFDHPDPVHNPPSPNEFDDDTWDKRIESDVTAGRFDEYANEALREHETGLSTKL